MADRAAAGQRGGAPAGGERRGFGRPGGEGGERGGFRRGPGGPGGERGGERGPGGDRRGGERREGGDRRGGRPPRAPKGPKSKEDTLKEWTPATKLGRIVKAGHLKKLEQIYLYSLPVKEFQIIDYFLGDSLKDEVLKIMPVQKQTRAGQRTRFKAFVVIGDSNGHVGLGVKCSKEVATSIRAAITLAKLSIIPIRRGYWGNKIGKPHTVPTKVTGKCGSVRVRIVPAPRGTGIVAAETPTKLLQFAGIEDVFTNAAGNTKTLGNFAKATFHALSHTYSFLTPELWRETRLAKDPFHEFTAYLSSSKDKGVEEKVSRLTSDDRGH